MESSCSRVQIVIDLARIRHVALDLDGTLYRGGKLFPATRPFLERLGRLGIGHTFLTNNTSLSQSDYVTKLQKLGLDAKWRPTQSSCLSSIAALMTIAGIDGPASRSCSTTWW